MTSATSDPNRPSDPWRDVLEPVGAGFMTSTLIRQTSKDVGMPASALYFRGRVGVLGDLTAEAAYDVLGIFSKRVVDVMWERSAEVSAATAAASYAEVCHTWGRDNLSDDAPAERAATLLEQVVDETRRAPLLLAQGWQRATRPADVPARLTQAATTVREIRGGLYFAALALVGLSVPRAMLADPGSGPRVMKSLGWSAEEVAEAQSLQQPGDDSRRRDAKKAADAAFFGVLGDVLGETGVQALGEALLGVERLTATN